MEGFNKMHKIEPNVNIVFVIVFILLVPFSFIYAIIVTAYGKIIAK